MKPYFVPATDHDRDRQSCRATARCRAAIQQIGCTVFSYSFKYMKPTGLTSVPSGWLRPAKARAKEARTLRETLLARFVQYSSQLNEASAKISARTTSGQTFSNLQTFTNEYGHKKSFAVTQL